jgi:hypothetical protein
MTQKDIALYRLGNQQICSSVFHSPKQVVHWMGAIQAQDYSMAKWAIGARLPDATNETVEDAIRKGEILRTHILRPTWHFVAAEDIRWMLELSAPAIKAASSFMNRQLGLEAPLLKKTSKIIEKELAGKQLTRAELASHLAKKGITMNPLRAAHILLWAELDGIVCNGPVRDNQFTYALLEERVKEGKLPDKSEALAQLASRYFTSHGPATLRDFTWWSGLPVSQARAGLEAVKSDFLCEQIGGEHYWFSPSPVEASSTTAYFLPAYDEFMVSYKERAASLDKKFRSDTISGNGIFKPIIVLDGRVLGTWKRVVKKDKVLMETFFFRQKETPKLNIRKQAADRFGRFLSLPVVLQNAVRTAG